MKLYYQELGETSTNTPVNTPMIILHGLFGASDNWLTTGRVFAEKRQVFLIDQRNHGKSPHSTNWDYNVMSSDLEEFLLEKKLTNVILLGHSMGGKTVMNFACNQPKNAENKNIFNIEKLIVADIAPRAYELHHQTILEGLLTIDVANLASRQAADEQLAKFVPENDTRNFLLKSLYRDENGKFAWRINIPVINEKIQGIMNILEKKATFDNPTLFIRGGKSNYIKDEDTTLIKTFFPDIQLKTIPDAGHWLHAEKPQEFVKMVTEFLEV